MVSTCVLFRLTRIYSRRMSCASLPGRRACFVLSTLVNLAERRADRWDGGATHHFLKLEQNITCSISSIAYNCAMDVSVKQLEEAVAVRKQIDQLQSRLASLLGSSRAPSSVASSAPASTAGPSRRRRGGLSAAGRARIAAAARARWARAKAAANAVPSAKASSGKKSRKKGGITPAGRRKLSQMMKARWAARPK